jgi:hypothetical protein
MENKFMKGLNPVLLVYAIPILSFVNEVNAYRGGHACPYVHMFHSENYFKDFDGAGGVVYIRRCREI